MHSWTGAFPCSLGSTDWFEVRASHTRSPFKSHRKLLRTQVIVYAYLKSNMLHVNRKDKVCAAIALM